MNLEVHHIRKLADLNRPGRCTKPAWMHLMAMRRRKTLVLCRRCHENIHAGRATAPNNDHWRAVRRETVMHRSGRGRQKRTRITGTSLAPDLT